jgi:hypothetical protein
MLHLAARALLWHQRACATRTSLFVGTSLRWSSSGPHDGDDDDIAQARKAAALAELRSRQRKAEAEATEAANRAAEAANRAAEAANRADKVKAEMAEAANRAKADAADRAAEAANRAAKLKAEATEAADRAAEAADRGNKIKAETAKIILETRVSEKRANDSLWAWRAAAGVVGVLVGAVVFGGLFLAYDHFTHHNKAHLRRRIKAKLVAGPDESLLPESPASPFLLPPLPIEAMNRPLLVLGASGSGKSSQLAELARTLKAKGVPVVYFRFRAARELDPDGSPRDGEPQAAPPDLTIAARRFYEAVGYPEQASIVSRWRVDGFGLSASGVQLSAAREHVESRFREAISDLYVVCGELYSERKADPRIPVADRRPVVLSDELHDLLHDRFRNVGGKAIFTHFGNEMTQSDVDASRSRTILAASGAELLQELRNHSAARGDRVLPYMQPDPPASSVRERLAEVGYDPATVDAIVATCGTRVRLIAPFLSSRRADVSTLLHLLEAAAEEKVNALIARCPEQAERRRLVQLLDKLAESPTSAELVSRFPAAAVQKPFPNEALLRHVGGRASFQSEAVRQAWIQTRGSCVRWGLLARRV